MLYYYKGHLGLLYRVFFIAFTTYFLKYLPNRNSHVRQIYISNVRQVKVVVESDGGPCWTLNEKPTVFIRFSNLNSRCLIIILCTLVYIGIALYIYRH